MAEDSIFTYTMLRDHNIGGQPLKRGDTIDLVAPTGAYYEAKGIMTLEDVDDDPTSDEDDAPVEIATEAGEAGPEDEGS